MPFILYCAHLALSLHKIGIGSAIKIKVFQPFVLYCAHLALSLQKNKHPKNNIKCST